MKNEKAIEILNALAWVQGGPDREETITAILMAIEALSDGAVQGWILCSERLPRENGVYIVSLEDAVYPWATFHNGRWFMLSVDNTAREFGAYEVIAWMPLPTPYKGGDSE